MANTPILFPMDPNDYWQELRLLIQDVLREQQAFPQPPAEEPKNPLLKVDDICTLFKVSKPTVYDWLNRGRLVSVKIESRRFFHRPDVEALILNNKVHGTSFH